VRCPSCNNEIAAHAKFCIECGVPLQGRCPNCLHDNPPAAKFCIKCGAELTLIAFVSDTPAAESSSAQEEGRVERRGSGIGERRHVTVLFCDLLDSTALTARLDPEDWHEIAQEYQREASVVVERFGGYVAKFLGDGVLVFFGWPHAHDNDPERGVRAGLALLESVAALNSRLRQVERPELSVRVGIHTGPAVIGEGGTAAPDIFGDTPNIAARIQAIAEPGTVVITSATRRLNQWAIPP
jgi:class 3 adenylate cyclase